MADVFRIYPTSDTRQELDRVQEQLDEMARQFARQGLRQGSGGGNSDGMDSRVTKLETHMEYVRSDLSDIKASLAAVAVSLDSLKQDVRDTKLAAQEAGLEAAAAKAHSVGKTTLFLTALSIVAVILAAMAFGGDRFDGGLNAASVAENAAARALSRQGVAKP